MEKRENWQIVLPETELSNSLLKTMLKHKSTIHFFLCQPFVSLSPCTINRQSTGSRCLTHHAANSPQPNTTNGVQHAEWRLQLKTNPSFIITGIMQNLGWTQRQTVWKTDSTQRARQVMSAPSVSIQLADWLKKMEVAEGCGCRWLSFILNHSAVKTD